MNQQSDIERLKRGYDAFGSQDLDVLFSLLDPAIVVEVHTDRPDIGSQRYDGHEGFLANFAELTDVFDDLRIEPREIHQHGDRILTSCRITGRGTSSGVEFDARIFHLWTIRDGKATRLEIYGEDDAARRALHR